MLKLRSVPQAKKKRCRQKQMFLKLWIFPSSPQGILFLLWHLARKTLPPKSNGFHFNVYMAISNWHWNFLFSSKGWRRESDTETPWYKYDLFLPFSRSHELLKPRVVRRICPELVEPVKGSRCWGRWPPWSVATATARAMSGLVYRACRVR